MFALDFLKTVSAAAANIERQMDSGLGSLFGISFRELRLLDVLDSSPGQRMRRIDLAAAMSMTQSSVTRALAPLERRGIIERESDPHDKRVAYARLTKSGKKLMEHASAAADEKAAWIVGSKSVNDVVSTLGHFAR